MTAENGDTRPFKTPLPYRAAPVRFGSRHIGAGHPAVVIAEIGINHEGDVGRCREMIEAAVDAGVDAVKLQTADPDEHYAPGSESHQLYTRAILTQPETAAMFDHAKSLGVEVFTTCGDMPTLTFIESLDPAAHKISSGMCRHVSMIRRIAETGRPMILSTGMAEWPQVDAAVQAAWQTGLRDLAIMQCVSLYPAQPEQTNLAAMSVMEQRYGIPAGFSDHTLGIEAPRLAVAAGATCIEKHLTFDTAREGFDHGISLNPTEFKELVAGIRQVEKVLGSGEKIMADAERINSDRFRRYVVARRPLAEGTVLSLAELAVMRLPQGKSGVPAEKLESFVGKTMRQAVNQFDPIPENTLQNI